MQDKSVLGILDRISSKYFFGALFFIQLLFIFQGLDMADEGSHSTFYQQIYNDPESVQYSFMYWFSGIVGGAWLKLFPEAGLIGLRIGGVLLTTLTAVITWRLLKKHLNERSLKLGLLFILLMNCGSVKDLNYNNISSLLTVFTVLFLFNGLKNERLTHFIVAGLFLSIATFTRLSNAAGLSMAGIIVYSGFFIFRQTIAKQLLQLTFFIGGFGVTTVAIIGIMKLIGHYDIFRNCLNLLGDMAKSGEGSYGLLHLIQLIVSEYIVGIFKLILPVGAAIILLTWVYNQAGWKEGYKKIFRVGMALMAIVLFSGFIVLKGVPGTNYLVLLVFAGLSLIATFFILFNKDQNELKLLALSGMMMTLMLVAGSDVGFTGSGGGSLWIGLPIAIAFFFGISSISAAGAIEFGKNANGSSAIKPAFRITENQLGRIRRLCTYLLLVFILVFALVYIYNDNPDRRKMIHPVNNSFARGVLTTRERAAAVNELLEQTSRYIKKNDYVLAYETLPMFHAMTNTRPFIRNSWPKLYSRPMLASELNLAVSEKKILPVIVCQKVKTNGNRVWPDNTDGNSVFDLKDPKHTAFMEFLTTHGYKAVWENVAFCIYVPPIDPTK